MDYQMNAAFADEVIECANMLTDGQGSASWRSYSGRAMYGAKCFAIVVDTSEFVVGVAMGRVAAEWDIRDGDMLEPHDQEFHAVEVVEAMAVSTRTDSMGRGTVVYWPNVEAPAAECEGHPAGPFDPMGETVYCDGSCTQ